MQHHFNTDIAKKYDIVTAILMDNFYYWIEKNRANNRNFKNDRYWTYNSKKAMAQLFPYLTERQLDYSLQKMKNNGLIMTANYNTDKYDKTLWYAITDFGYSILQNCEMYNIYNITNTNTNTNKEIYKEKENSCANAQKLAKEVCTPTDLRSTNETTDTNLPYLQKEKDSKVIVDSKKQEVFDCLWTICMRKESKEQAKKTFAKLMKECKTEEEIKQKGRAIYQNYQIACKQWQEEQREKQYIPLLSTWLNDNVPEKMIKRSK